MVSFFFFSFPIYINQTNTMQYGKLPNETTNSEKAHRKPSTKRLTMPWPTTSAKSGARKLAGLTVSSSRLT